MLHFVSHSLCLSLSLSFFSLLIVRFFSFCFCLVKCVFDEAMDSVVLIDARES